MGSTVVLILHSTQLLRRVNNTIPSKHGHHFSSVNLIPCKLTLLSIFPTVRGTSDKYRVLNL